MAAKCTHTCSDCAVLACRSRDESKYPAFCLTEHVDQELLDDVVRVYQDDEEQGEIARVSAGIEGEFYGKLTRVEETIEFIKRMGYKKIGIASCVGLMNETRMFAKILKANKINYYTVGCKIGAVDMLIFWMRIVRSTRRSLNLHFMRTLTCEAFTLHRKKKRSRCWMHKLFCPSFSSPRNSCRT